MIDIKAIFTDFQSVQEKLAIKKVSAQTLTQLPRSSQRT